MYRPRYLKKKKSTTENLFEVYLKDMDSVPIVYYKGKRVFKRGLVSVCYEWKTKNSVDNVKHSLEIKGIGLDVGRKNIYIAETIKLEGLR